MAPTNTAGVFQTFGNGYYELRCAGDGYNGRDAEGRLWIFQKLAVLADDDFFALTRIEDASGINHVDLQYDVFDKFSPDPITTLNSDQISARELVLRELSYSHDLFGRCPKYRIRLAYSVSPVPLGFEFVTGRPRTRSRLLQSIELLTAAGTNCEPSGVRSEAKYRIGYTTDPLTGQRLANVDMLGPPEGVTPKPALPVVTYRYGDRQSYRFRKETEGGVSCHEKTSWH
jgi:hypothetical protein